FNDAPPSRDAVTTSFTCAESTDVNTFTNSGMMAPASVTHLITVDSFHQSVRSLSSGSSHHDAAYVMTTETIDVSHTSVVSGASKFIVSTAAYFARAIASLMKYEIALATIIMTRMTKIQRSSSTCTRCPRTARRMKVMSATPVT